MSLTRPSKVVVGADGSTHNESAIADALVVTGIGGTSAVSAGGVAYAGQGGVASAGHRGVAVAGLYGRANAGSAGLAFAHSGGNAQAGDEGVAWSWERGAASAGVSGVAAARDGHASVGLSGTAVVRHIASAASRATGGAYAVCVVRPGGGANPAGVRGIAATGTLGVAVAYGGNLASGGPGAVLAISYTGGDGAEHMAHGVVDGVAIKAWTPYTVDGQGNFVESHVDRDAEGAGAASAPAAPAE